MREFHILSVLAIFSGVILYLATLHGQDMRENAELRMYANRRLRAASGMELPGFTKEHLERITRTAEWFGTPYQIPAAVYQIEQGGEGLEVGIQALPWFISQRVKDPKDQQIAALDIQINEEMGKYIVADPVRLSEFLDLYATRHNDVGKLNYRYELSECVHRFMAAQEPADVIKKPKRAGNVASPKIAKHRKRRKR